MDRSRTADKVKMTEKALHRGIIGSRHAPVEGIVCVLPTHARGRGEELLEEMVKQNEAGWAQYNSTGTYHIVETEKAVEFIKSNGGSPPWGF